MVSVKPQMEKPMPPPVRDGKPLQLISHDPKTGQFQLGEEALDVLRRIRAPIAVVAVCGRARTGKSYILNQLLDAAAGFEVASSYRPCTKGLWMWSHPIPRTALDGSNYYLVLLDTEGIDAYNQTTQDGVALFSLAVLLSSLFVFNQMGGIDEAALDRLALVTELTKRIRVRSRQQPQQPQQQGGPGGVPGSNDVAADQANGGGGRAGGGKGGGQGKAQTGGQEATAEDPSSLAEFTPSFMWLLRDFYYDLTDDKGVKQSPRDYLETALMPTAGTGPAIEEKNRIRESIKSLFPDRDCFTLVRPVADEAALRGLGTLPREELRPEFVQGVSRLTQTIHSRAQPKRLGAQMLTGPLLAGLAAAYVRAINHGAVPTIASAWHAVAESECRAACHAAEDAYRAAFNPDTRPDETELAKEHTRALSIAAAAYKERAVGDPALRSRYKQRYVAACCLAFEAVRERKLAAAAEELEARLAELAGKLHAEARLRDATFEGVAEAVADGVARVVDGTCGTARWPKLLAFCHTQYGALGAELLERQQHAAQLEVQRLTLEAQTAAAEAERLRAANTTLQSQLEAAQKRIQDMAWDAGAQRHGRDDYSPRRRKKWLACFTP